MGFVPAPPGGPLFFLRDEEIDSLRSSGLIRDPLSEVARKERRALLGISALGTIRVKANILPQKISALGIDFGEINKTVLLRSIALVATYFLETFFIYAISDFLAWRIAIQNSLLESFSKSKENQKEFPDSGYAPSDNIYFARLERLGVIAKPVSSLRATLEFIFPIGFALYAIFVLFTAPL
jgi:hypothetical protein